MTATPMSVASIAARCLRTPGDIDPDTPLALLGLDSLSTIEMAAELEETFGCELPAEVLSECTDARSLASLISSLQTSTPEADRDKPFDAMLRDAVLPADVRPTVAAASSTDLRAARTILLTGATGFLGSALLDELLQHTSADVICLARNPEAWRRAQFASPDRVRTITGDLSHPRLGLGDARFEELAHSVDAVLHCGAAVNWVYSYSGLRLANVTGTLELLRLACRRGLPFHFISSMSVCYPADGPATAAESFDALPHLRGVHLGYAQSKIVSETLVNQAGARGLPVRIYRPALISGHSDTGAFNEADLITALVRGCVQMGTAPDLDWKLDCQPVNVIARSILELSGEAGPTFHLGHPRPRGWRECVLWMRMYGYPVRLIAYHAWLRQLDTETAPASPSSAAHPLRPLRTFFLNRHADAHGLTLPELYEETRRTAASSARTLETVADSGVTIPPLDAALLETYFDRFRVEGALPPPAEPGRAIPRTTLTDPATMIRALLGTDVTSVRVLGTGSEHSIVSELTAWRSHRTTGLFRAEVTLRDGSTRRLRLKAKAEDSDVIAVGDTLAGLVDPAIGRAYRKWSGRIGFTASHVREIEIYRQCDPRFVRHTPALLGACADAATGTWMLALEEIEDASLLDTADTPGAWQRHDIEAAIAGLASLQSIWYGREHEMRGLPWIGHVQSTPGMVEMTDLWTALATHAAPAFSSWADPGIASLQRRLIGSVSRWWPALDSAPRTLIHHDFNPRNVCVRAGELCAYDWELATVGAPQRDLAEFLLFVLPPDPEAADVVSWLDYHRRALERETGTTIDRTDWHRGFGAALYDLLINRLATYALIHRIRPQSFLPRVLRTWRGLYEHFPLEDLA